MIVLSKRSKKAFVSKFLLLFFSICCLVMTVQGQGLPSLSSGYYHCTHVTNASLDKRMKHEGKFQDGLKWRDESGENTLFLSYAKNETQFKQDIHLYQYCEVDGQCQLVWNQEDFGGEMCEMTFIDNSLQLLDLDQDGILEACFMYQNRCKGSDSYRTHLILTKKGQKMSMEGTFSAQSGAELEKGSEPFTMKFPPIFKNFMQMNWNEFKGGEFEYAKSILFRTSNFVVLQKEYMLASGGTEYELLDPNGLIMKLQSDLESKINQAVSIDLMPDGKTLLYASLHGVGTYDPATKVENLFVSFLEDTEAISSVAWSQDKSKIAFTALNHNQYPERTKIFVLTLSGNTMLKKEKFDAKLMCMAASNWVVESPSFRDNLTLEYTEMVIKDNEPAEGNVRTIRLK